MIVKSSLGFGAILIGIASLTACSGASSVVSSAGSPASSASVPAATSSPVSNDVTVKYTILVVPARDYPDVESGREVKVTDGAGTLLGFGSLTGTDGAYEATFTIHKSGDGFYVVSMGRRGELNFKESDIKDGVLTVFASLGM